MQMPSLTDTFGRVHDDLRLSVTDKCNLRCRYCIPVEPDRWLERAELLTYEEITRLVTVLAACGVRSVRLTGGEPLLRRGLPDLVAQLTAVEGIDEVSLTTNAVLLADHAQALADAGLARINVSLDSLRPERFEQISQREGFDQVLAGLAAARAAGLDPIKINAVAMRGFNDDEAVDFARWAREHGYHMRFIEYMPLESGPVAWSRERVVGADELLEQIVAAFPLTRLTKPGSSSPAVTYGFSDGAPGSIGVIPTVTAPFCNACARVRLSADGRFRNCLFAGGDTDVRTPLRDGASTEDLVALFTGSVTAKGPGGCLAIQATGRALPLSRTMHQIGG
jgi:cyclic pyranopterin phosphate synthase